MGRPGTLEYLDGLAEEFIRAHSENDRQSVLERTIQYKNTNITDDDNQRSSQYYIRIMVCVSTPPFQLSQKMSLLSSMDTRSQLLALHCWRALVLYNQYWYSTLIPTSERRATE